MKYLYIAYNKANKMKRGMINAGSPQEAEQLLLQSGFQRVFSVQDTRRKSKLMKVLDMSLFSVNAKDVLSFSRELANLIHAGVPIVEALQLIARQTRKASMRSIIENILADLRGGKSLSQAIGRHHKAFSSMYLSVIRAAEQSGELDTGLNRLTEYIEKQEEIKKRTMRAVMYPIMVVILAMGVSALLVTAVLPPLVGMFESLDSELPLVTKIVVAVIGFIIDNKFVLLGALVGLVAATSVCYSIPSGKYKVDSLLIRMPLIGQIIIATDLLRFCRSFAMLLKAGGQIPQVLGTCSGTIGNQRIRAAFAEGEKRLMHGQPFSNAMTATKLFPATSIATLVIGEHTGELESALDHVANRLERTNNERIEDLISMIGPALTVAIGIVVGMLAVSIISPMYSLAQGI